MATSSLGFIPPDLTTLDRLLLNSNSEDLSTSESLYPSLDFSSSDTPLRAPTPPPRDTPAGAPPLPSRTMFVLSPIAIRNQQYTSYLAANGRQGLLFNPQHFHKPLSAETTPYVPYPKKERQYFTESQLEVLKICVSSLMGAFSPLDIGIGSSNQHPIHAELMQLILPHVEQMKHLSIDEKIQYCEQIVSDLCQETHPYKAELLEIGVRTHLSCALIHLEEQSLKGFFDIRGSFPEGFQEKEIPIKNFGTKNDRFVFPYQDFYIYKINTILTPTIDKIVQTALPLDSFEELDAILQRYENLIENALVQWKLPEQFALEGEIPLRLQLSNKLMHNLSEKFLELYNTGNLTQEHFEKAVSSLKQFSSNRGTLENRIYNNWEELLLRTTFNIDSTGTRFTALKEEIEAQSALRLAELQVNPPMKKKSFFSSKQVPDDAKMAQLIEEVETLANNKKQILAWVENRMPSAPPEPSAPPMEEDIPLVKPSEPATSSSSSIAIPLSEPSTTVAAAKPLSLPPVKKEDHIYPVVSYVDIAYDSRLDGYSKEVWEKLPPLVRRDILRRLSTFSNLHGKAEGVAKRALSADSTGRNWEENCHKLLKEFKEEPLSSYPKHIDEKTKELGERILDLYYSGKTSEYIKKFKELPITDKFLYYVFKQADRAGIPMRDHKDDWARHHWADLTTLPHSVQALERYLHSSR